MDKREQERAGEKSEIYEMAEEIVSQIAGTYGVALSLEEIGADPTNMSPTQWVLWCSDAAISKRLGGVPGEDGVNPDIFHRNIRGK